ncbi:hypothetical protein [Humibacter sp.]|uniref:hypothetical protein n=1 Tax=Humibacter sp. TaxID=1940291 RepID=UPI003F7ECFDA
MELGDNTNRKRAEFKAKARELHTAPSPEEPDADGLTPADYKNMARALYLQDGDEHAAAAGEARLNGDTARRVHHTRAALRSKAGALANIPRRADGSAL